MKKLNDKTIPSCELIILAGYPQMSIDWLKEKAEFISPGAIVIDAVGVKRHVCNACFAIAEGYDWTFVGAHPMAGTQYSGYAHARANMFVGAPMVLVPPRQDDIVNLRLLDHLQQLIGGFFRFLLLLPVHHKKRQRRVCSAVSCVVRQF